MPFDSPDPPGAAQTPLGRLTLIAGGNAPGQDAHVNTVVPAVSSNTASDAKVGFLCRRCSRRLKAWTRRLPSTRAVKFLRWILVLPVALSACALGQLAVGVLVLLFRALAAVTGAGGWFLSDPIVQVAGMVVGGVAFAGAGVAVAPLKGRGSYAAIALFTLGGMFLSYWS